MNDAPTFAIIGHPNEGKSSVVSTLTEDDSIGISSTPGETKICQAFEAAIDGQVVLRFIDTPGFQNPNKLLNWIESNNANGAALVEQFIDEHAGIASFHHDCELLRPLSKRAGIVYVVDASRPMSQVDIAEMEILRRIGLPRIAVINSKTDCQQFLEDWKAAFRQSFNAIRIFDACNSSFSERIELLDTLRSVEQDWSEPLTRAIKLLRQDWNHRLTRAASSITELIEESLLFSETKLIANETASDREMDLLMSAYKKGLSTLEKRTWDDLKRLFRHHRLNVTVANHPILSEDLFSEKTWQAFGLTQKQLALTASALGAGLGVGLDAAFAGLAFGIFTAAGAAVGAGASILKGKNLARMKINRMKVGGLKLSIGPNRNEQFPFILLDRTVALFLTVSNWAHARQDSNIAIENPDTKVGLSNSLSNEERALCMKVFAAIRKNRREQLDKLYPKFRSMLTSYLEERES